MPVTFRYALGFGGLLQRVTSYSPLARLGAALQRLLGVSRQAVPMSFPRSSVELEGLNALKSRPASSLLDESYAV